MIYLILLFVIKKYLINVILYNIKIVKYINLHYLIKIFENLLQKFKKILLVLIFQDNYILKKINKN